MVLAHGLVRVVDARGNVAAQHGGHHLGGGVVGDVLQIHVAVELDKAGDQLVLGSGAGAAYGDGTGVLLGVGDEAVDGLVLRGGEDADGVLIHGQVADGGQLVVGDSAAGNHGAGNLGRDVGGDVGAVALLGHGVGVAYRAAAARLVGDGDRAAAGEAHLTDDVGRGAGI